ncbi:hypothetical protein ONE63_005216 [Megalurothrips usitatus]|uniref:Uncharacterized protein n=1 Tax=Megalurothrips usitatus TaxID=439358 RepID=A0AAV7XXX7_9NEOP|nr:hypothetical protein ONE63_005216 [Megalurothrips usitatus]
MAEKVPASLKGNKLRRLVAEERRLLLEKSALEEMLKNVQALRTKLKVEQIQLGSNLQAELGESYVEVPLQALPVPEPVNMEQEERNIAVNKPTLDLGVNNFQSECSTNRFCYFKLVLKILNETVLCSVFQICFMTISRKMMMTQMVLVVSRK